ncbi:MAG: hypothetical protein J5I90_17745, partial [Caldilineales bacterium]|nr:hypothetical protein [Caldilineales bacterium]
GTAPTLNVPERLQQFDNAWYGETIAQGRPTKGMPVWGSVLSPQQIGDVVALIEAWRNGEQVVVGDLASLLRDAAHALEHGETGEAQELLEQAVDAAEHEQAEIIEEALAALANGDVQEATHLIEQVRGVSDEMPMPEVSPPSAQPDPGVSHVLEAVHALEHDEVDEAMKALQEAMGLLPPGDLFEAAEHALEDVEGRKPEEALQVLLDALTAANIPLPEDNTTPETTEPGPSAPGTQLDPGVSHLLEAAHALEHDEIAEATKALQEAMGLLSSGDLFEAAEHTLGDVEGGKPVEALQALLDALTAANIPLPE